ncbi:hypothetical protein JWZ98_03175 [Methylomonas sp. EFPC1]|uniref:hypothetical protein n=1 Tax=Methylomonas sp. EFPC1 TaxID=2812647 RepID=UPI001966D7B9|nr:hypothetical protein [Methylomonas sp. EFPC1]QSB01977.1 hypothetical protein JWZ98_03175 [Methylomonas sp. EFPC1]
MADINLRPISTTPQPDDYVAVQNAYDGLGDEQRIAGALVGHYQSAQDLPSPTKGRMLCTVNGAPAISDGSEWIIDAPLVKNESKLYAALTEYGAARIGHDADFVLDDFEMPADTKITGSGTIRWDGNNTISNCIKLNSRCGIQGVKFASNINDSKVKTVLYAKANATEAEFDRLRFDGLLSGNALSYEKFIYFEQGCTGAKVTNNRMKNGGEAIMGLNTQKSEFRGNVILSPAGAGFRFYGGKFNTVASNKVYGSNIHGTTYTGRTVANRSTICGINFLTFGFIGQNRGIVGNIITDNELYGISEESIGLDTHGNESADAAENPYVPIGTLQSVSLGTNQQTITIQEPTLKGGVAADSTWALQCYVIMLTGAAAGFIAPVISSTASASANTATITIPRNMGDLVAATGDKMLITYGIMDNVIGDNIIRNGCVGISLWGSCWGNNVDNNNVLCLETGLQIASVLGGSVVNGADSSGNPLSPTLGYSGLNNVRGNNVRMQYEGQPTANTRGNTPLALGTWAYGAPDTSLPSNLGTNIEGNTFISAKNAKVGGSHGSVDAGNKTAVGCRFDGNTIVGGGKFAMNKTDSMKIGKNFLVASREDYNVATSANNTNIIDAG